MERMLLLVMSVFFSITTLFAQETEENYWTDEIEPVADAADQYRLAPVVAAADGSVYKTGTFTQTLEFGDYTLEPVATSAYVLKYGSKGEPLWAVALKGAATITAAAQDKASGGVVVAGTFADKVELGTTSKDKNTNVVITGMEDVTAQVSSFIAVYDGNGELTAWRQFVPELDGDLVETYMYYPEGGDVYFTINNLKAANGKVYFTASYTGNITIDGVSLKGRVLNVFDFMYMDVNSVAAVELDSQLKNARLLVNVQSTEQAPYEQMQPQDINLAVDAGDVYVAWVGFGNLTMTTPEGSEDYTFEYGEEAQEHAFVVANVGKGKTAVFHAPATEQLSFFGIGDMLVKSGKLYLGGTYNGALAFDNTLTSLGSCDVFVTKLDGSTLRVIEAYTSGYDENATDVNRFSEVETGLAVFSGTLLATGYVQDISSKELARGMAFIVEDGSLQSNISASRYVTSLDATNNMMVFNSNEGVTSTLDVTYFEAIPEDLFSEADWTRAINDVVEDEADAQISAPILVTEQGDVVKAGTFTEEFDFAGTTLTPVATSSYVVKYDKNGNEVWGLRLAGAATVTALASDAAGNIYVAGRFADQVQLGTTNGNDFQIDGMEDVTAQVSSFIVVYDANGHHIAHRQFVPELDADLLDTYMYFPEGGDVYFTINNLEAANGKVYFTASYTGNTEIDDVSLKGRVLNVFDFMYMDINSVAAVELDSELGNARLLANVQSTEPIPNEQMQPQDINLAVDGDKVYVAWVGFGNLTMTTPEGSEDYTFEYGEEAQEHAFVVAEVESGKKAVFHAPATEQLSFFSVADMAVQDGVLYLAGTYNGSLAFGSEVEATGASDAYVAALNADDLSVLWAATDGFDEGETNKYYERAVGLILDEENVGVAVLAVDMGTGEIVDSRIYVFDTDGDLDLVLENARVTSVAQSKAGRALLRNEGTQSTLAYWADEEFTEGIDLKPLHGITVDKNSVAFAETGTIVVYDAQGRCVKVARNASVVSTESLPRGLYFVTNGRQTVKLAR